MSAADERAEKIVRACREMYDAMSGGEQKKGGGLSNRRLKAWARDLRHAEGILRRVNSIYELVHPAAGMVPAVSALSAVLIKRAEFLESLQRDGRPPSSFALILALTSCLRSLKIIYERVDGKPHWKEIGDRTIKAFRDVLPKGEDSPEVWARKTFNRCKHFADIATVERRNAFAIRRRLKNPARPEMIFSLYRGRRATR